MGQEEAFELGTQAATTASAALFGKTLTILIAGITFIIVARLLGPSSYGIYSVAMAVVTLFTVTGEFGIGVMFTKFIAEYSGKHDSRKIAELLVNGYFILLVVCLLLSLLSLAISGLIASYALHNSAYTPVLEFASFIIILNVIFYDSYFALVGFGLGKSIGLASAIQVTVQAVISITLAFLGYGALAPIIGLILSYIAGSAFVLQEIFKQVDITGVSVSMKEIKRILRFSVPLAVSNMITAVMNNITIIVLGIFVTTSIVGEFGIVQKTGSLVSVISDSIGIAILPLFAAGMTKHRYNPRRSNTFYSYAVYVAFLFITPIMLYAILLSKPFTITIFNGVYANSSLYLAIMSVGVLVGIAGAYATSLLTSANKVKLVLKCSSVIALVQLVFLIALVPTLKGIGAAVQLFIVTPTVTTLVFVYAAKKTLSAEPELGKILRVVVASLISAAFILPLIHLIGADYILLLVAAAIEQVLLYPPILAITGAANRKDLGILKQVSGSVPVVSMIMGALVDYSLIFCLSQKGT